MATIIETPEQINEFLGTALKIGSGLFWTLTYILIIRRGFLDKRYGMPMVALCANISWEFIFSFIFPHNPPQLYVDYVWFGFDVGIVIQFLSFGRKDFPAGFPARFFYPVFLLTLALAFFAILMLTYEFNDTIGIYAAFGQNFLMSVLFVRMLLKRNGPAGQSVYIALFKMIGTILPCILFYMHYPHSYLLTFLYFAILIFDVAYFVLLYNKIRTLGMSPWKRL